MNNLTKQIINDISPIILDINFDYLRNKSILITGAAGLLGTYLLATIKILNDEKGFNITTYATTRNSFPAYLKDLVSFHGCHSVVGDITDNTFCSSLPNVDIVVHAAGYGQPGKFMEDKIKTLKLNTYSTFNLFDKLNAGGKFLFLSTSELYNGLSTPPFKESQIGTTNTDNPRSCYIEGKRCGEAICIAKRETGIDAKSVRLSLAYGPGTKPHDQRALNSFIEKALNGKIALMDQGGAKRTYIYVADAIKMIWNILLAGKDAIYNIGGDSRTTIREVAEKIGTVLDVPVLFPENSQSLDGAPEDVYLDMKKYVTEFGNVLYVDLDVGLQKTIEWQKELYTNY